MGFKRELRKNRALRKKARKLIDEFDVLAGLKPRPQPQPKKIKTRRRKSQYGQIL